MIQLDLAVVTRSLLFGVRDQPCPLIVVKVPTCSAIHSITVTALHKTNQTLSAALVRQLYKSICS